jgi:hypothetical protein
MGDLALPINLVAEHASPVIAVLVHSSLHVLLAHQILLRNRGLSRRDQPLPCPADNIDQWAQALLLLHDSTATRNLYVA